MEAVKILLAGLEKTFYTFRGAVQVLKKIDLEIKAGEFFVLLGPSGCGKSTLLNLLAGLEKPSQGRILFGDEEVANPEKGIFQSPFDRDIAMVFQSYALYPHMTVEENITFPLTNMKPLPTLEEMREKVAETAKFLRIDHLLDRKPAELSGGQRQRVAIGRAIVRNPKVCLMDEPLSNLDAQLRMDMRAQLKDLQNKLGVTTIYVTHDQLEAMTLGHRIAILNNGFLQQVGSPVHVYNNPATEFVARFIGSPSMNLFKGNFLQEAEKPLLATEDGKILLPSEAGEMLRKKNIDSCTLGVRPEHFEVLPAGQGDFDVSINVVENIGSEYLLYSFRKEGQIVVKTPVAPPGKTVSLRILSEKAHLFDQTGIRMS